MEGVIAAGSPQTAEAGAEMLRRGGNAVDAAVAAAFASFIAEVAVVNLGGSGLAHIYDPQSGASLVYDFFSTMPGLGRTHDQPLDFRRITIDFGSTTQDFHVGRGSVAVPGNIFGLCQMAEERGTLPLAELLEPAIALARDGMPLRPFQADTVALLGGIFSDTDAMRRVFRPRGRLLAAGEHLFIPDLLETLQALARYGAPYARTGRLAQAMLEDAAAHGGLLTEADLAAYTVHKRQPIQVPYHDYEVLLPPPCSSGGTLIAFTLKLLDLLDVPPAGVGSADALRLLYEVMAATTRARAVWERELVALPESVRVARFLDDHFVAKYAQEIRRALATDRPSAGIPESKGPNNTSHLSVIDRNGMAVSLTTTAGETAGYIVPGTGYILNNMLGEEDLNPLGWHQWQPGARISTMMAPTIVLHQGHTRLVTGSGGSARIRSAIVQVLNHLLDFRQTLRDTIERPRVHLENGILQCEAGFAPAELDRLAAAGVPLNRWTRRSIYFGGAHSVSRTPHGRLVGAGDPRRDGAALTVA